MYSGEPLNEVSTMVEALMARENLPPEDTTRLTCGKPLCLLGLQTNSSLPKVAKLDHAALAQHDVLRFHIAMKDAVGVQIVQSGQQLAGHLTDLRWAERRQKG